ncbi:MAG: Ig-like domain-containing protein [Ignavibacteriales bacterium]|nr:Ig-like domain-containing protein [Ignavibacteriales bacterium]
MNLKIKHISGTITLVLSLFLVVLLISCANQLPPGGGPQDTVPPEIISVFPANGTTNFSDNYFEIEFSEYVDKRSVQDAIFISPAIDGSLEYDWSGKSLRVNFPGKLKDSMTYIVTVGTNATDLNNRNKMAQAYSLSFSTGNKIDRGIIQGKVYSEKPQGIMLFAYPVYDTTINPTKHKPKYISQAGANGEYKLLGLAFGKYRVFAVQDEFTDLIYNVGDDAYGCPYSDVTVSEMDSVFHSLNFYMIKEDTLKPRLISATMTDQKHILLEFSEPIDSLIILNDYSIVDSSNNLSLKPLYAFQGKGKKENVVLVVKEILSEKNNNFVIARNIKDLAGNITGKDFTQLIISDRPDTSAPNLYSTKVATLITEEKVKPEFIFLFDDGFDTTLAKKGISVNERKGKVISSKVTFPDAASIKVKIMDELKQKENYEVNINLNDIIDAAGNKRDSIYKYGFKPVSQTDYAGVSGKVKLPVSLQKEKVIIVLKGTDSEKFKYQQKANEKYEWKFNKVNPGKYILWSFIDKDSSASYKYGKPYPFQTSDRFTVYPDTLKLRARWPVGDVVLEYK